MSSLPPIVLFTDEVMLAARWHNLAIMDYRGPWQMGHIDHIRDVYREIFTRHKRAVSITMAHPGTEMSGQRVNAEAARLVKSLRSQVEVSVVVVEERGPMAAMYRGLVRTVNVLSGNAGVQVASSIADGARLVLPHISAEDSTPVSELQLVGVLRRLREKSS
jgi:hypothetical protein